MMHSLLHNMDIHFPNNKKTAFPHHTTLVIEDLTTLGFVGGWHNVSNCRWSGSHTH